MRHLKEHRFVTLAAAVVLLGGVTVWMLWPGPPVPGALAAEPGDPEPPEPLDPVAFSAVEQLRADLALTDEVLVGMDLSAEQMEQVLLLCRQTALQQADPIRSHRTAIGQAAGRLREARRKIRIGPRDEAVLASLPTLQQELAAARQTYEQYLDTIRSQVASLLSASQAQAWAALRAHPTGPVPLRLVNPSGEQGQALAEARRQYRRRRAQAADAAAAETLRAQYEAEVDAILDSSQRQIVEAYAGYGPAASERMVEVRQRILVVADEPLEPSP